MTRDSFKGVFKARDVKTTSPATKKKTEYSTTSYPGPCEREKITDSKAGITRCTFPHYQVTT